MVTSLNVETCLSDLLPVPHEVEVTPMLYTATLGQKASDMAALGPRPRQGWSWSGTDRPPSRENGCVRKAVTAAVAAAAAQDTSERR